MCRVLASKLALLKGRQTMTEHTAGPWEWDSDGHIYPETETEYDDGYSPHIAKVQNRDGFEGNIRLIAAAPDLYEALRTMVEANVTHGIMHTNAEQAIAKAEGREE